MLFSRSRLFLSYSYVLCILYVCMNVLAIGTECECMLCAVCRASNSIHHYNITAGQYTQCITINLAAVFHSRFSDSRSLHVYLFAYLTT